MPDSWESVASKPEFQSLPPEQKTAASKQYFDTVVAPKVPKENLDAAMKQFTTHVAETTPRSMWESTTARAGEALDEKPSGLASFVRKKVLGFDPITPMNKAFGVAAAPVGAAGETLERKAGQMAGANPVKLEKAARDTGDVTSNLLSIMPGAKVAKAGEAVGEGAAAVGKAVAHPIQTTGKVVDSALTLGGKALSPIVKPAVRSVLESDNSVFGGGMKTAMESKTAKEGEALGKKMGVKFSAGELTGNPTARNIEDALANSARWSSKFTEANEQKTTAIVNKFKQTLASISPTPTNVASLGENLTKAYKSTIDSLVNTRSAQGEVDFKAARESTGGNPVIVPNNVIQVYKKFIEEGASPTATKEQVATANQAKKALAKLTEKPAPASTILDASGRPIERPPTAQYKKITVNDLQNGLQGSGEAAKSPGSITGGLKTASDRRFDKALKGAYESDLDAAADSGTGEGAAALKTARDNWRAHSAKIGDIQQTALGKVVGSAERNSKGELVINPEKMAERFLKMEPTQIKATMKFLDQEHPDVARMARRYTLEAAYRKAAEGAGQRGAGMTKNLGMAEFVKALPDDAKLNALMGDSTAAKDVKDVAAAMNRLIDYGARQKGSQTAQRTDILSRLYSFGAKKIYQAVVDDTLAEELLDPSKRKALVAEANKINGGGTGSGLTTDQALGAETDPLAAGGRR